MVWRESRSLLWLYSSPASLLEALYNWDLCFSKLLGFVALGFEAGVLFC